jgi:hypothetical protein
MMELQSEQIDKFIPAFIKAQEQINHAVFDSTNPAFKSRYASLESVVNAVKAPLNNNGFALTQSLTFTPDATTVVTQLTHTSGQWMRSYIPLMLDKNSAQGQGSAITYARRYSLLAICGMGADDDDANIASAPYQTAKPPAAPSPKPVGNKSTVDNMSTKPPAKPVDPARSMQTIGDYRCTFGKSKGKSLSEMGVNSVSNMINFIKNKADEKFKASDDAKTFLFFADAYLKKANVEPQNELDAALGSNAPAKGDVMPPSDWADEPLPEFQ